MRTIVHGVLHGATAAVLHSSIVTVLQCPVQLQNYITQFLLL